MRAEWIADELRAAGLTVIESPGWKQRGRDPFTPKVVVAHHTAGPREGDAPSLNVCIKGRGDLSGPLCHVLLSRSGVCHVVAAGVANHAGPGSWQGVKGNSNALGIEAENTGRGEPWSRKQLVAFQLCAATLARRIGRDETCVVGHKEWTPRKIDPAGIDMDSFRAAVRLILEDDDMPLNDADKQWFTDLVDDRVKQVQDSANLRAASMADTIRAEGKRITGEILGRLTSMLAAVRRQSWWDSSKDSPGNG